MAATHYMYHCLKISGPKGVITVRGCTKTALLRDKSSLDFAQVKPSPGKLGEIKAAEAAT